METTRRRTWAVAATLMFLLVVGLGLGVARAAGPSDSGIPNTAGQGGHARAFGIASAPAAVLSETAKVVLDGSGATTVATVASAGVGDHLSQLLAAALPDGEICYTVAHAAGKIIEPLNCSSGAYLRVWTDASGTGEPGIENSRSMRVIALTSTEVSQVRLTFLDGSTRTLTPDTHGVVAVETAGSQNRPTRVDALASDGSTLATIAV